MTANLRHLRAFEVLAYTGGCWHDACALMANRERHARRYLERHDRHDIAVRFDRNTTIPCDCAKEPA